MTASAGLVINVGDEAPDFTLPVVGQTESSDPLSLFDYRGKKVIIFMWASW